MTGWRNRIRTAILVMFTYQSVQLFILLVRWVVMHTPGICLCGVGPDLEIVSDARGLPKSADARLSLRVHSGDSNYGC